MASVTDLLLCPLMVSFASQRIVAGEHVHRSIALHLRGRWIVVVVGQQQWWIRRRLKDKHTLESETGHIHTKEVFIWLYFRLLLLLFGFILYFVCARVNSEFFNRRVWSFMWLTGYCVGILWLLEITTLYGIQTGVAREWLVEVLVVRFFQSV